MSEHEKMRLTPEEQALKERLMRTGGKGIRKNGTGKVPEDFWKMPQTSEGRSELVRRIARSGKPEDIKRGAGRIQDELFWKMPRPKDPEGLLLKALLEDREQGR